MLAEIAAANAAFAAIKMAIQNGREIADVATQVGKYVNATEDLRKQGEKKKRGAGGADLEEFMHLEKLKQQEEELKQLMIYTGRPGLWHDWIRFQAEARVNRQKEKERLKKRRQEIIEIIILATAIIFGVAVLGFFAWFVLHLKNLQ